MTRLSKDQIRQNRIALEAWQRPSDMLKRARKLMAEMGDVDLFTQPGVDFILEAWAAAQYAKGRRALAVRLVVASDRWPDFEVRTRGRTITQWEFTEVRHGRRGDEYRRKSRLRVDGKHAVRSISIERLTRQAAYVPGWIRKRCRAKLAKRYSGRVGLLVYLNWNEYGARHQEIENSLLAATKVAKGAFTEIWVLWKARLYRTWRNGMAAELMRDLRGLR